MIRKKLLTSLVFINICWLLTFSTIFAQLNNSKPLDSLKTSIINSNNAQQVEEGDVDFRDGTNSLLRITDEGNFGAIELKNGVPSNTTNKLYNEGGTLKFDGVSLSGSSASEINDLSDAITTSTDLFLGTNSGGTTGLGGNTSVGQYSLLNTTSSLNTALGFYALSSTISGSENVAIGANALDDNVSGIWNVAVGSKTLELNNGSANTAIGTYSLKNNTSGFSNAGLGDRSLFYNTTGKFNVAIGNSTLYNHLTGEKNTAIGYQAGYGNVLFTSSGNVFIGFRAGYSETGNNKLYIENSNSSSPLIWGDFTDGSEQVKINGDFHVTGNITSDGNMTELEIGDSYQGGIIFWIDETGEHGLISAPTDQSAGMNWSSNSTNKTGASGDGIGAGIMNTLLIITENRTGTSAAKTCADLVISDGSVNYGDWYLPSLEELQLLYAQKALVGGFTSHFYWSSQETASTSARTVNFVTGSATSSYNKSLTSIKVRAIRKF